MKDARDNFRINLTNFAKTYGHCDMGRYLVVFYDWEMIDSAFWHPNYKYKIQADNFKNLIRKGNIINEATIIFQENNFLEDEKNIALLKSLGYTDWKNLDNELTLEQAIVLAYRLETWNLDYETAKKNWQKYINWFNKLAPAIQINEMYKNISRDKFAWILSKASWISYEDLKLKWVWSWNNPQNIATRFEGLIMIGRAYDLKNSWVLK